jgi:hypothetical protein
LTREALQKNLQNFIDAGVKENLEILHKTRPNSLWMRIFVDAKSDELVQIFSGGPKLDINKMVNSLSNFSPSNTNSWNKLKF